MERPIKLQFDDSMEVIEGLCRNISIGGMFILFESSRPAGSLVRFELELGDGNAIRGLGEVVWMRSKTDHGPEAGFGLKFRFLEQRDRQLIFKLVSQHIKDRLSKKETAPEAGSAGAGTPATALSSAIAIPPEPPAASEPPAAPRTAPPEPAAPKPAVARAEAALDVADAGEPKPETPNRARGERESTSPEDGPPAAVPIDLDPSVGETPMYELGLAPEPRPEPKTVDPGTETAEAPLWEGGADLPEPVEEPEPSRRALSLLPVAAVLLLAAAAGFYLFKDDILSRFRDAPPVEEAGARQVAAGGGAAPAPAVESTGEAEANGPEAAPPSTPGSGETASPPEQAPEPGARTTPPPATASPPAAPPAAPGPAPPTTQAVAASPTPVPPPSAPAAASTGQPFSRLIDISWSEVSGGLEVVLTADGTIPTGRYRYFHLGGDAPREVIKMFGVREGFERSQLTVGGPAVRRIRTGFHRVEGSNEQHVVIDLLGPSWRITEVRNLGPRLELLISDQ